MKINDLKPPVQNRNDFSLSRLKFTPESSGCYVIATYFDDIIYIGQASNLKVRMSQHLKSMHKIGLTPVGKGVFFYYSIVEQRKLSNLERGWINQFELTEGKLPILNLKRAPNT